MSLKSSNKTEVNTTELVISIDPAAFEAAVEQEYQRQKKNIQIKGFRKGKVSRKLAEREFGEGAFYEGAINALLGPEIDAAVKETGLVLVDRPNVEVTSISKEDGVELKAICVTKPEIEISDYKGIKASKTVKEITDEDIDKQIEMIRKKNARIVSVDDRAAQLDDEVIIDFEGFFGDEAFEGGKGEDHSLRLGSGQFIPGFEDQIVGKSVGDEFDVNVTFPEDYQAENLAGKPAVFKVKLKSITETTLPELDDEFASEVSAFDTFAEYEEDTRKTLELRKKDAAEREKEGKCIEKLIEASEMEIPEPMIELQQERMMEDFDMRLSYQGLKLDQYLQITKQSREDMMEQMKPEAITRIKSSLVVEAVAAAENFEVSDEEVDEEIKKMAEAYQLEVEKFKELAGDKELDSIRRDLKNRKAVKFLAENAKEV